MGALMMTLCSSEFFNHLMQTYKVIVDDYKIIRCYNDKGQHRLDGPAVQWPDGSKEWWVNDERHRLDGPAIEDADGSKEWWVNGKQMTEQQFKDYTKFKPSCEGKIIEVDGIKYKLTAI